MPNANAALVGEIVTAVLDFHIEHGDYPEAILVPEDDYYMPLMRFAVDANGYGIEMRDQKVVENFWAEQPNLTIALDRQTAEWQSAYREYYKYLHDRKLFRLLGVWVVPDENVGGFVLIGKGK